MAKQTLIILGGRVTLRSEEDRGSRDRPTLTRDSITAVAARPRPTTQDAVPTQRPKAPTRKGEALCPA
jgi:hypothetical protein